VFGRLKGTIWPSQRHRLLGLVVVVFEIHAVSTLVVGVDVGVGVVLRDSVLMSWDKVGYRVSRAIGINRWSRRHRSQLEENPVSRIGH
jgi:hypothetical protein